MNRALLRELLRYYPTSGRFVWRKRARRHFPNDGAYKTWNTRYAGQETGSLSSTGYLTICIFDKAYLAHRLAWFYVHSYWPVEIDHLNKVRHDNRLSNLKAANSLHNSRNMSLSVRNKSGVCGVCWSKTARKWHARITVERNVIQLGFFDDLEHAAEARRKAEALYGFSKTHGK